MYAKAVSDADTLAVVVAVQGAATIVPPTSVTVLFI
jgi:hypothetical protein